MWISEHHIHSLSITYDKLLEVVLQRRASEKESPIGLHLQQRLVSLRLEILQDMTFVIDAALNRSQTYKPNLYPENNNSHPNQFS